MSRIDQALKAWESANGTKADANPIQPGGTSPLAHYPREEAHRPVLLDAETSAAIEFDDLEKLSTAEPLSPDTQAREQPSERLLNDADFQARLVTGGTNSVSLEQYRRLAAVLHEEQVQGNLKTVMITSAVPHEGKTLTIMNLALTLSGSYGRRVLVIDGDLRAPALHRLLEIRNTRGLGDVLRENSHDLPIVEVSSRLSVLTAGRPGPAPLAELTSDRMANVIKECAASFDWVLVDTPPVGLLPDAQVLARVVGAVVFVIAAGSTPMNAVERAIAEIGPDSIIGTVLNRVDDRRIPEANYYRDYHRYETR